MKVLVTGAAGFIGYSLCQRLLAEGIEVLGLDSLNDYYSVQLKLDRLAQLGIRVADIREQEICRSQTNSGFRFIKAHIENRHILDKVFRESFDAVINLAGQAGVRHSKEAPSAFIQTNIVGFSNLLEFAQKYEIEQLIYASSSSVYGQYEGPAKADDRADQPVSLYAATKRSNELLAHAYSAMYHLPTTGLRFFTVYGPWGRPDAAYYIFTEAMRNRRPVELFNSGEMWRDFTYIDDVVEALTRALMQTPTALFRVLNVGTGQQTKLTDFVEKLAAIVGQAPLIQLVEGYPEDIRSSCADTSELKKHLGFEPNTPLHEGLTHFVRWHGQYQLGYRQFQF